MKPLGRVAAAWRRRFAGARRPASASPPDPACDSLPRFAPLDPAFVQDPYPTLRALQERDPVHRSPMGTYVLTRYDDVVNALADPRLGNAPARHAVVHARNRPHSVAADVANNILPFLDEPQHAAPRRSIGRIFGTALREDPPEIAGIAERLIAKRRSAHEFDVLRDFGTPLSVAVLCRLLGIPEEDEGRLTNWSRWFFYLFSSIPSEQVRRQVDEALAGFRAYLAAAIEQKRRAPGRDLISRMLERSADDHVLSEIELIDTCMLLFADGVENVDAAIANAVAALIDHPDELARLRADASLLPSAVEECLRFETPAQFIGRVAREAIVLQGVSIPAQAGVWLVLGAANRDSEFFEGADRLDIGRTPNLHLAFGKGRHSCIGASLVRLELEVALRTLLEAFPEWRPSSPERTWQARLGHRWLAGLSLETR